MSFKKSYMSFYILLGFFCLVSVFAIAKSSYVSHAATGSGVTAPVPDLPVAATDVGNGKGVVLMYHHLVSNDLYNTGRFKGNNAVMPIKQFESQMKFLAENGYNTMFMSEANNYLSKNMPLPNKTVIVTFDDGYESNYVYAYPILEKYKIKATIAVVVKDSVDVASHVFDETKLTHLSFNQMREMQKSGLVEFGSHSYNGHGYIITDSGQHDKFFTQKLYIQEEKRNETEQEYYQRIEDDLRLAKHILEKELSTKVNYFAYPYGAYNANVKQALKNTGYSIAVTVKPGTIDKNSDIMILNRKNVNPNIALFDFSLLISAT